MCDELLPWAPAFGLVLGVAVSSASAGHAAGTLAELACDVCVVGGGSAGYGAALAAARAGAKVVLIEKQSRLGGTSTSAFVANWQPGPGEASAEELYTRVAAAAKDVSIAGPLHTYQRNGPYGIAYGVPGAKWTYRDTLRRAGVPLKGQCCVVMRPEALAEAMLATLRDAGVTVLLDTAFLKAEGRDNRVGSVQVAGAGNLRRRVTAKVLVDASGGAHLCRAVGCQTMLGVDGRDGFGEPSAPEKPGDFLNAISLCYRIRKVANSRPQPRPNKAVPFGRSAYVSGVTAEELVVNPLALVEGEMLAKRGYDATLAEAREGVVAHWHWLQGYPHFQDYELADIAPMLGIRESYRVVTDYILTEHDLAAGLSAQQHEDMVAVADHAMDIHGRGGGAKELRESYGIPYRCLIPKGWTNLLVAGRCAGFSHVAASSCRLSRTMMALGHAAGAAAAEGARTGRDVREINVKKLGPAGAQK